MTECPPRFAVLAELAERDQKTIRDLRWIVERMLVELNRAGRGDTPVCDEARVLLEVTNG